MRTSTVTAQDLRDARFMAYALEQIRLVRPQWRKLANELETRFPEHFKLPDECGDDPLTSESCD